MKFRKLYSSSEASLRGALALSATLLLGSSVLIAGETRRVEGLEFDHIDVMGSIKVEVRQGDVAELRMYGTEEDLDSKPFFLDGSRLVLGVSRGLGGINKGKFSDVKYKIVVPNLHELHVKGSGTAYVKPFRLVPENDSRPARFEVQGSGDLKLYGLEGPAIELRIKGSGDIRAAKVDADRVEVIVEGSGDLFIGELQAKSGEVVVSGSGDVEVTESGFVQELEVNVIGSGDADLRMVSAERVAANIVGSGTANLGEIMDTLDAVIIGSGDIRYDGEPDVDSVELGSGECRQRN